MAIMAATLLLLLAKPPRIESAPNQFDIPPLPVPLYGQGGSTAWSRDFLTSNDTCPRMFEAGCFITSRAMVFDYFERAQPSAFSPGLLNRCYPERANYHSCDATWANYPACSPPGVTFNPQRPKVPFPERAGDFWSMVESELLLRRPVMLVYHEEASSSKKHMVVITGRTNGHWTVLDPNGNGGNGAVIHEWFTSADGRFCRLEADCRAVHYMIPVSGYPPPGGDWSLRVRVTAPGLDGGGRLPVGQFMAHRVDNSGQRFNGTFAFDATGLSDSFTLASPPEGLYRLYVRVPGYLSQEVRLEIPLRDSTTLDVPSELVAGDINHDDTINALDMSILVADLGTSRTRSDLNQDGEVNTFDYAMLEANYLERGALRDLRGGIQHDVLEHVMAQSNSADARLWLEPSRTEAQVGDDITVRLMADTSSASAIAANVAVGYDPGALAYSGSAPGQAFPYVEVVSPSREEPGRLVVGAYSDTDSQPLQGASEIVKLTFRVLRSTDSSSLRIEYEDSGTLDSNLAAMGGIDLLSEATGVSLRLRGGEARPKADMSFDWPLPSTGILASPHAIRVSAGDAHGTIERVAFVVRHNRGSTDLGTDWDDSDGWSVLWNPLQFEPDEQGVPQPWLPERFQFDALAYVRYQDQPSVIRSPLYEFAFPQYELDSIIVNVVAGADVGEVVSRHGGTPDDVREDLGNNTYLVGVYHLSDWTDIEPLVAEYNADPDVGFAETNGVLHTWEGAAASLVTDEVPIQAGWNLLALPSGIDDAFVTDLIADRDDAFDRAYGYDPRDLSDPWKRVLAGNDMVFSERGAASPSAVWLHARSATRIKLSRTEATPTQLWRGWNLWGYGGQSPERPATVLQGIGGHYERVVGYRTRLSEAAWLSHDPSSSAGDTLLHLLPGQGYWIKATDDVSAPMSREWADHPLSLQPRVLQGQRGRIALLALDEDLRVGVQTPPGLPMTVLGTVQIDEGAGSMPSEVEALRDGRVLARAPVQRRDGALSFALDIADGSESPESDALFGEGALIAIRANAMVDPVTIRWSSGGFGHVTLFERRSAAPTPPPVATATVRPPASRGPLFLPFAINTGVPREAAVVTTVDVAGRAERVAIAPFEREPRGSAEWAYVVDGDGGLYVVDVRAPTRPRVVRAIARPPGSGSYNDLLVDDGFVYVAAANGIDMYDAKDPSAPTNLGRMVLPCCAQSIERVLDDTLAVADGDGFWLLRMREPDHDAWRRYVPQAEADFLASQGHYLYVGTGTNGVKVYRIDASNESDEVDVREELHNEGRFWVGDLVATQWLRGVNGAQVWASTYDSDFGLWALWHDYATGGSNSSLTENAFVDSKRDAGGIDAAGGYVVQALPVTSDGAGRSLPGAIALYDGLSDQGGGTVPVKMGIVDTPGAAFDVVMDSDYAFVADGEVGLTIIEHGLDLHDPRRVP